jgi:hypothetical protein
MARDLLPDAGPVLTVREALYRAGQDYSRGLKGLAYNMGLEYDALQKKLHIDNASRYPTPEELEELVRLTRDPRLLAALVRPAGAVAFIPTPVPAAPDALQELGKLLQAEGEFVGSLHQGAADSRWERHEVDLLRHHAHRVIGRILGIVAGAELAMEACVPGEEVSHG